MLGQSLCVSGSLEEEYLAEICFFQTDQISLVLLNFLSQSWSTPCFLKYCAKVLCHLSFPLTSKNPDVRVEEKKNF